MEVTLSSYVFNYSSEWPSQNDIQKYPPFLPKRAETSSTTPPQQKVILVLAMRVASYDFPGRFEGKKTERLIFCPMTSYSLFWNFRRILNKSKLPSSFACFITSSFAVSHCSTLSSVSTRLDLKKHLLQYMNSKQSTILSHEIFS